MKNNKLPARKRLRLPSYDYGQQGAYFITICCKDKEKLFGDIEIDRNAKVILNPNGLIAEKYIKNIPELVKYIVMPNHVHLIILLDEESKEENRTIPKIVNSLKTLVSKELGFSCWQRSYHDRVIRNDKEFEMIWQYVEHNAETWNQDCYYI